MTQAVSLSQIQIQVKVSFIVWSMNEIMIAHTISKMSKWFLDLMWFIPSHMSWIT